MSNLFVLTPEAQEDLKDILLDIAEDSPGAAERLRSEFYDGLRTLGRTPGIGHHHQERLSRKYRFWSFYSYVVAHAWEIKSIQIVAVVHGAGDLAVFFNLRANS